MSILVLAPSWPVPGESLPTTTGFRTRHCGRSTQAGDAAVDQLAVRFGHTAPDRGLSRSFSPRLLHGTCGGFLACDAEVGERLVKVWCPELLGAQLALRQRAPGLVKVGDDPDLNGRARFGAGAYVECMTAVGLFGRSRGLGGGPVEPSHVIDLPVVTVVATPPLIDADR
jgi:hypothetical protein